MLKEKNRDLGIFDNWFQYLKNAFTTTQGWVASEEKKDGEVVPLSFTSKFVIFMFKILSSPVCKLHPW